MKNRNSFTLIELVLILLIGGIMAAMAITQGPDIQGVRSRQAAYKIKSDLRYAQSYELVSRKRTRVAFDTDNESYSIYYEQTAGNNDWTLAVNPLTKNNFTVDFTQLEFSNVDIVSVNFEGTGLDLVFDSSTPYSYNSGTQVATQLTSEGIISLSDSMSVTVEPNTGKVSVDG
ncbi:MAG: prepilin-type N-terminal cleavage/methylation domain-containing protein [Candidatus Omnitrophota bacterium]